MMKELLNPALNGPLHRFCKAVQLSSSILDLLDSSRRRRNGETLKANSLVPAEDSFAHSESVHVAHTHTHKRMLQPKSDSNNPSNNILLLELPLLLVASCASSSSTSADDKSDEGT